MNDFKAKRIIVTGGAGFIGSNFVKRLLSLGAQVTVIDNLWRGKKENLNDNSNNFLLRHPNNFIIADLSVESACLELIRDADIVYHLADVVAGIDFIFSNENWVFNKNILINTNVLKACILNNIKNYIYVGTACSFPKHLQMQEGIVSISEDQTYPADPESSYGWSKLMGEYEAELARKHSGINVGILRLHNAYGPGVDYEDTRSQVIPSLIKKIITAEDNSTIEVWGSGKQYRDFIYIDDIIDALVKVFSSGMNQGTIQIGTTKPTFISGLAEKIISLSKKDLSVKFNADKPEGDKGRVAVIDKARLMLDWQPVVSIDEGLLKTYEWMSDKLTGSLKK